MNIYNIIMDVIYEIYIIIQFHAILAKKSQLRNVFLIIANLYCPGSEPD